MIKILDYVALSILLYVFWCLLFAFPFMYLWNASLPHIIYGIHSVSYMEMVAILMMYKLLKISFVPKIKISEEYKNDNRKAN